MVSIRQQTFSPGASSSMMNSGSVDALIEYVPISCEFAGTSIEKMESRKHYMRFKIIEKTLMPA